MADCVLRQLPATGGADALTRVADLLAPITQLCVERIARSRAASNISPVDIEQIRDAFNTILQPRGLNQRFHLEDYW